MQLMKGGPHHHHEQLGPQPWRWRRAVVLFVAVLLPCILIYRTSLGSGATALVQPSLAVGPDPWADDDVDADGEDPMLEKVLKKAAMANNTVIITTLNAAWASPGSVFDVFLESFKIGAQTERLLDHLVIANMDGKAYKRCLSVHRNCVAVKTEGVDLSGQENFMSDGYLKMMWRRIKFLLAVLEKGYSFIFTDTDIVWFRNPLAYLYPDGDFQIACDRFNGDAYDLQNLPNGGFTYVRSNNKTKLFYEFWYTSRLNYPRKHDQDVLNHIKFKPFTSKIGLNVRFLDTTYFGGLCEPSKDFDKVCTMHANCCIGLQRKVDDLKLMLKDWTAYRSRAPSALHHQTISWSVPKNCSLNPVH